MADQQRQEPPADPDPPREGVAQPTSRGYGCDLRRHPRRPPRLLELLPNEKFLIEHDRVDAVTNLRELFQKAIEPTFTAAVERATGRRVVGFASHFEFGEPPFAVEIFRLEPR